MTAVKIRLARAADAEAICCLRKQLWFATYQQPEYREALERQDFTGESQIAHFVRSIGEDKDFCHWVAAHRNEVIGWAAAQLSSNEVVAIYVAALYQGRGIGRQFYDTVLARLDRSRDIHIYVVLGNRRAETFYRKNGFAVANMPSEDEIARGLQEYKLPVIKLIRPARHRS